MNTWPVVFHQILSTFLFGALQFSCTTAQTKIGDATLSANGNLDDIQWQENLSGEAYDVMINKGTEEPFNNAYYNNHQIGVYLSAASSEPLFSSSNKFDSGSGWPSFSAPIDPEKVEVVKDTRGGMVRDEVLEKSTGLHLGHLFNDGPPPSYQRYCSNSAALKFVPASPDENSHYSEDEIDPENKKAYFASGCFWCVEAIFESVKGVGDVVNGYAGGHTKNPTYEESNTGKTGHAEAVMINYDPSVVSFATLVDVYFGSQNPTQVNGQGPDKGSQYRSILFYENAQEQEIIEQKKSEMAKALNSKIAAEVKPFDRFWKAEDYHQNYEKLHPENGYIKAVSIPRLNTFKQKFPEVLKSTAH